MDIYRSSDGEERLWFEPDEIERTIEDELKKASLYPTAVEPVVDLERFVEQHLGAVLDQYAELEPEVLGVTEFPRHKPPKVAINRDLTGSALDDDLPGQVGRWRATLAHEGAHIVFHRILFELPDLNQPMFPTEPQPDKTLMRCLKRDVAFASRTRDWREVQANMGMAALLMPRKLFTKLAERGAADLGVPLGTATSDPKSERLIRSLSRILKVSRQAVSIRLETAGVLTSPTTPSLPLS